MEGLGGVKTFFVDLIGKPSLSRTTEEMLKMRNIPEILLMWRSYNDLIFNSFRLAWYENLLFEYGNGDID